MGMSLVGDSDFNFYLSAHDWATLLLLAHRFGWRPVGTECPQWVDEEGAPVSYDETRDGPWDGSYSGNAGQGVTAADALAIAIALEKALTHLSDNGTAGVNRPLPPPGVVCDFITFCRQGGFEIW